MLYQLVASLKLKEGRIVFQRLVASHTMKSMKDSFSRWGNLIKERNAKMMDSDKVCCWSLSLLNNLSSIHVAAAIQKASMTLFRLFFYCICIEAFTVTSMTLTNCSPCLCALYCFVLTVQGGADGLRKLNLRIRYQHAFSANNWQDIFRYICTCADVHIAVTHSTREYLLMTSQFMSNSTASSRLLCSRNGLVFGMVSRKFLRRPPFWTFRWRS